MPYSTAAIPQAELDLLARDAPLVLANHCLDRCVSCVWSNGSGLVGDADQSSSDAADVRYLFDRSAHRRSYPNAIDTEWWVVARLQESLVFDTIAIIDHNLAEGADHTVQIQIADSNDFATNPLTLFSAAAITAGRHVFYSLGGNLRITNAERIRFRFQWSAAFLPQIGEIWIGRRRQLRLPADPHDHRALTGSLRVSGPAGARDVLAGAGFTGAREIRSEHRELTGAALRGIRADSRSGVDLVAVCQRPTSAPHEAVIAAPNGEMEIGRISNPDFYGASLSLIESAPMLAGY